jgi:transcriptional regulator GlxA family with amidase domain
MRPSASRRLLRFPAAEVTGRFVDLDSIFPSASRLREQLAAASNDRDRVAALERWLADAACVPSRPEVEAAVGLVLQSGGRASIQSLTRIAGVSVRQIERQFREDVGLSPKLFSRIIRLQVALRRVRAGAPLPEVAVASGYCDQAHMTRDFRRLAAMSPGGWQNHAGDLAPLFVEAGVSVPALSSPARAPASG